MHWDYFEPEKRDCSRECATKKYVDARDDTMLRTALDKIVEVNKDAQSDWTEQDPTKASYIKNKPDIPSTQQQADWAETNTSAVDYIKNKPTVIIHKERHTFKCLQNLLRSRQVVDAVQ